MPASASNATLNNPPAPVEIDERVRRFRMTGNAEELWPGVNEGARVEAAREIERVTRELLAGATQVIIDPKSLHDARTLGVAAHTTGVGPVLGAWVTADRLVARDDVRDKLVEHLTHSARRWDRMMAHALPALDALLDAGITPVALKGLHTGSSLFAQPGERRMSDVDLLIRPDEALVAGDAMRRAGFRPYGESGVTHKQEWIARDTSQSIHSLELSDELSRWTIELHTSLDSVFYPGAVATLDALAAEREVFRVQGRQLAALRREALFIHLACHCSELEANRLLRVYELALLAQRGLDFDLVLTLLRQTRAARYTWPALVLVDALAPALIDQRILDVGRGDSTWAARHTVRRLTPAGGRIGDVSIMRALMWAQSPLAVLHRLWRVFMPRRHAASGLPSSWRTRLHQLRTGRLSLRAPDERPSASSGS